MDFVITVICCYSLEFKDNEEMIRNGGFELFRN